MPYLFRKTVFQIKLTDHEFRRIASIRRAQHADVPRVQPVMLRELLSRNGRATVAEIARALLSEDRSQIEYYSEITKNMVGRVLTNRDVVKRDGGELLSVLSAVVGHWLGVFNIGRSAL